MNVSGVKPYHTGLVLSGGSARGFAHLGVIKALEEYGIYPEIISGVSAGAIVGAFYADGYSPEEILKLFIEKKLFELIHLKLNRQGFLKPSGLQQLLKKHLRARQFSDLKIPLVITASDMNRGKAVYFTEGILDERIMASAAIPAIFQPVIIDETTYVDGGLIDNLPVQPLLEICERIIGVSVNPNYEDFKLSNYLHLLERTFYLSLIAKIQERKKYCQLFIEPPELKDFGLFEISKAEKMFDIGYKEAMKVLEKQKDLQQFKGSA